MTDGSGASGSLIDRVFSIGCVAIMIPVGLAILAVGGYVGYTMGSATGSRLVAIVGAIFGPFVLLGLVTVAGIGAKHERD